MDPEVAEAPLPAELLIDPVREVAAGHHRRFGYASIAQSARWLWGSFAGAYFWGG
jgi:hypothetical protein